MSDFLPDYSNRLAWLVGRIFHPYIVCIPTMMILLNELTFSEVMQWTLLISTLVLTPGITLAALLERRGWLLYQRQTRTPLYIIGWISVLVCLLIIMTLDAPQVLIASLLALLVWAPLQLMINAHLTKVSAHAAVIAGCAMGLMMDGRLVTPVFQIVVLLIVLLTGWSRVATKNHTLAQVALGLIVGALPVLLVFPLVL